MLGYCYEEGQGKKRRRDNVQTITTPGRPKLIDKVSRSAVDKLSVLGWKNMRRRRAARLKTNSSLRAAQRNFASSH